MSNNYLVRDTAGQTGRHIAITPENSTMRQLSYGRIRLTSSTPSVSVNNGGSETALLCLKGTASVAVDGETFNLGQYDALYIPKEVEIAISADSPDVDILETSAPVSERFPVQFVGFAQAKADPKLSFIAGQAPTYREVTTLIGANVQAGRLMMGITRSAPGNWTSWPPHEHAAILEEIYVYIEMPPPAAAIQFVYTQGIAEPEFYGMVHEGDAVLMPAGYHPNVAVPGHPINFVWIMGAHHEVVDRKYGVVNVDPDFRAA